MDLKEIKQIIELMERSDLNEFEIEQDGLKLRIRRSPSGNFAAQTAASAPSVVLSEQQTRQIQQIRQQPESSPEKAEETGIQFIKSPMVGTFYRATTPEVPPFVELNQKITNGAVVCIIEAMKVMNEIQTEISGAVIEILCENGTPVEYGQPLFKVQTK